MDSRVFSSDPTWWDEILQDATPSAAVPFARNRADAEAATTSLAGMVAPSVIALSIVAFILLSAPTATQTPPLSPGVVGTPAPGAQSLATAEPTVEAVPSEIEGVPPFDLSAAAMSATRADVLARLTAAGLDPDAVISQAAANLEAWRVGGPASWPTGKRADDEV